MGASSYGCSRTRVGGRERRLSASRSPWRPCRPAPRWCRHCRRRHCQQFAVQDAVRQLPRHLGDIGERSDQQLAVTAPDASGAGVHTATPAVLLQTARYLMRHRAGLRAFAGQGFRVPGASVQCRAGLCWQIFAQPALRSGSMSGRQRTSDCPQPARRTAAPARPARQVTTRDHPRQAGEPAARRALQALTAAVPHSTSRASPISSSATDPSGRPSPIRTSPPPSGTTRWRRRFETSSMACRLLRCS